MARSLSQQRAAERAGQAAQTPRMRALFAARAAERELAKLAAALGCTPEEAAAHRAAGRRWCHAHGLYGTDRCAECRREWRQTARAKRVQS